MFRTLTAPPSAAASANAAAPGLAWRVLADVLRRHPQPWGAPLLLNLLERAPAGDVELVYALRLALKTHALTTDAATLRAWAAPSWASADRVADVCVAVPTPAAAEYLLGHLARTKFTGPRAGEFARRAVEQLPPERLDEIIPLLRSLQNAAIVQRLTLAEGLANVAAKPTRTLPPEADAWMRAELVAAVSEKDSALALRAANALKPLSIPEKAAPLRRVALDPKARETLRTAAVRALDPEAPDTEETLTAVLASNAPHALRRAAAELLGTPKATPTGRAALVGAFPSASADLALALANGLAKTDAGAAELLDLVAAGRVRASLLRHRYLTLTFEKRPAELRTRAAELTRALPPEDARLDAVIAQRLGAIANFKADAARGAKVFTTHCATCHRFQDMGGNIGPSLDGVSSRSTQRLIEDILDPNRNVDPAFRLTTATLKNGESKSGLNLREQGDRVLLLDPSTGQDIIVPRAEITELGTSTLSPMPAAFETLLSEQEFFDLLEFLRAPAKQS
jgi:putative heme-binding domain-containing protein